MLGRIRNIFWPAFILLAIFGLYKVKYKVQAVQTEIAEVEQQLERERESLHVVAAEWAYLNNPARLQELSSKYLALQPVKTHQFAHVENLPFPQGLMAANATQATNSSVMPVVLTPLDGR